MNTTSFAGRAKRWLAAVGCAAVAAGASAADPVPLPKLPDAAPRMTVVGPNAPPPVAAAAPSAVPAADCGGDCGTGSYASKHQRKKAERKVIKAGAVSCAHAPALPVPPVGTFSREAFATQVSNARAEYFVIFREEWLAGTTDLNATGQRHMDGIVRRLGGNSHPVKVEPTGFAAIDEARRAAVAQALARAGVDPVAAAARVILGGTRAEGLRYEEIQVVYFKSIYGGGGSGGGGYGGFGGVPGFGGGFGGFGGVAGFSGFGR